MGASAGATSRSGDADEVSAQQAAAAITDSVAAMAERCSRAEELVASLREEVQASREEARSMREAQERAATQAEEATRRAAASRSDLSEATRKCSELEERLAAGAGEGGPAGKTSADEEAAKKLQRQLEEEKQKREAVERGLQEARAALE